MEDDYALARREIPVGSVAIGGRGAGGIRHWGPVELHGLRPPLLGCPRAADGETSGPAAPRAALSSVEQ